MSISKTFFKTARVAALVATGIMVAGAGTALAHGDKGGNSGGKLHGPGTSHNPIIVGNNDGHSHKWWENDRDDHMNRARVASSMSTGRRFR